jgi:hypothetical protein
MAASGECLEVAGKSRGNGFGGSGEAADEYALSVWCGISSAGGKG